MAKRIEAKFNWINLAANVAAAVEGDTAAAVVCNASTWEERAETLLRLRKLDDVMVQSLRPECANLDRAAVKAKLLPIVERVYGLKATPSESRANKGEMCFDRKTKEGEAATKAWNRLTANIMGTTAESEEVEVPAELIKAAKALAKLASEYEGARSLASKALAKAWTE